MKDSTNTVNIITKQPADKVLVELSIQCDLNSYEEKYEKSKNRKDTTILKSINNVLTSCCIYCCAECINA